MVSVMEMWWFSLQEGKELNSYLNKIIKIMQREL